MSDGLAAVRSETTKILTLRSVVILSMVLLVLHVVIQAVSLDLYVDAVAGIDAEGMIEIFEGSRAPAVPEMTEQLVAAMFTPIPLVPVAGALIGGSEFWTGQVGVSVTALPSRARLVVAKALATTLYTVALSMAFAVVTTVMMYPAVRDWNPGILVSPGVIDGYLRVSLIAVCVNLLALGLTLVTRRALVSILVMALLLGATISQVPALVLPAADAALPISAARNLLFSDAREIAPPLTSGPDTAALVLLAWALAAVAASIVVVRRRDAR